MPVPQCRAASLACLTPPFNRRDAMFVVLAIILAIAWALGFTVMKVSSLAIHILLVLALFSVILHFVRRGSKVG